MRRFADHAQCVIGVLGFEDFVTAHLDDPPHQRAEDFVIFDDDDGFASAGDRFRAVVDSYPDRMSVGELFVGTTEGAANLTEDRHLVFDWELITRPWSAAAFEAAVRRRERAFGDERWPTVVLSNHDQPRQASRLADSVGAVGAARDAIARAAGLFSLTVRGTPFLYYGEELGMGDVDVPPEESIDEPARHVSPDFPWWDRSHCRTPMPWTPEPGAGFTTGTPWLRFGPDVETRNVAAQGADPDSVLAAYRRILAVRRTLPALQVGALRLALVVFLILPLLPDASVGPFGGVNPRRIWFVVVVTGGISLAGYAVARWQGGRKGTLLTALVGSLVSSTAVTVETARRIREGQGGSAQNCSVSLASLVMLVRVLVLTAIVAPAVLGELVLVLAPALLVGLGFAAAHLRLAFGQLPADQREARPPTLTLAFVFAATVAVVTFGVRWAEQRLGPGSGALVIALGGALDVDAAIAAVGALPHGAMPVRLAALAIAAPVVLNTLFKLALLVGIVGPRRAVPAGAALLATGTAVAATATIVAL